MAHNEEILKRRGADWNGKVRIIGISIDKEAGDVVKHIDDKGWNSPEHYHHAGSEAFKEYGGYGVPHVVLVDTKGRIVFIGNPTDRQNLEQDFDDLLAGKTLNVEKGDDSRVEDGGPKLTIEEANAQINIFKNETAPAL